MAISPLLTVFGFLHRRATAVGTGDVFLFLGFRLHLAVVFLFASAASERNAILKDGLEIVFHNALSINGGTNEHP